MYISLFTASIPVNYTSEFRELFQATMYGQGMGKVGDRFLEGQEVSIIQPSSPHLFPPRTEAHNCPLSAFTYVS